MNRKYDVFERFSDGSSLWRACVVGLEGTRLHLSELTKKSNSRFYAIAHGNGKTIYPASTKIGLELLAPRRPARRSRSATA
jgi:hypothetical protein